jgi:arsenite transporter
VVPVIVGADLACGTSAPVRVSRTFAYLEPPSAAFTLSTFADTRAAVRPAGRTDRQPLVILLLAVPIIIQVYFNAALPTGLTVSSASSGVAGPSALIEISSNSPWRPPCLVRLSVGSGARDRGRVLIEVPVMLSIVRIVRRSRGWYERGQSQA